MSQRYRIVPPGVSPSDTLQAYTPLILFVIRKTTLQLKLWLSLSPTSYFFLHFIKIR